MVQVTNYSFVDICPQQLKLGLSEITCIGKLGKVKVMLLLDSIFTNSNFGT